MLNLHEELVDAAIMKNGNRKKPKILNTELEAAMPCYEELYTTEKECNMHDYCHSLATHYKYTRSLGKSKKFLSVFTLKFRNKN